MFGLMNKANVLELSPKDAKATLDTDKSVVLIDVRTAEEHAQKHIPGSLSIPLDTIEKHAPTKLKDKEAKILVYCQSGRRSSAACNYLAREGYTNVHNMGGIQSWPYETSSGPVPR